MSEDIGGSGGANAMVEMHVALDELRSPNQTLEDNDLNTR